MINQILQILANRKLLQITFLSVISGMPFAILYTALVTWVFENGISLETATTLAIARLPYSLKYLWSPLIDQVRLPIISNLLGERRSWMLLCTFLNILILVFISFINPVTHFNIIIILATFIGVSAASFDIAFDAFRIDELPEEQQGIGAAWAVTGYRMGLLITGAGALYISGEIGWPLTFIYMAGALLVGGVGIFFIQSSSAKVELVEKTWQEKLQHMVINPFVDFFGRDYSLLILLAIILYKIGGVLLGFVSTPFYLELGYSKKAIAVIVKGIGLVTTIAGSYVGGLVVYRVGIIRGLIICGIIQMLAHASYIWLNFQPLSSLALTINISIDDFATGMGTSALVAFLSILCNKRYSATQYALLSSFSTLMNNTISTKAGLIVKLIGWNQFFILSIVICLPALFLLYYLNKKILV